MVISDSVSLLCSLYKNEKIENLQRFLTAVSNQKVFPSKTIVVFDGEIPKKMDNLVENFKNKIPNLVVLRKNWSGLPDSLNQGSKLVESAWFARCDTDDIPKADFIDFFSREVNKISTNTAIVAASVTKIYSDYNKKKIINKDKYIDKKNLQIRFKNLIFHPAVCINAEIFLKSGMYPRGRMEDFRLWTYMLALGYKIKLSDHEVASLSCQDISSRRIGTDYMKAELDFFYMKAKNKPILFFFDLLILFIRLTMRLPFVNRFVVFIRKNS